MPDHPSDTGQLQQALFHAIKGAPATILLLLLARGTTMTQKDICEWSGYSDKPTAAALEILKENDLIEFHGRSIGWSIKSEKLRLPIQSYPQANVSYPQANGAKVGETPTFSPEVGETPTFSLTTTTTTNTNTDQGSSSSRSDGGSRKNSDLIRAALRSIGIGWNRTTQQLINCAWVTPEYIEAHGKAKASKGLIIRRMLDGDPPPKQALPKCPYCHGTGHTKETCPYSQVIAR